MNALNGNIENILVANTFSIPEGFAKIANGAFEGSPVESVAMPETVTEIGLAAFKNCEKLEKITFKGDGLKKIMTSAFQDCSNLKEINIPSSVTFVGPNAFMGTKVKDVKIPRYCKVAINAFPKGALSSERKKPVGREDMREVSYIFKSDNSGKITKIDISGLDKYSDKFSERQIVYVLFDLFDKAKKEKYKSINIPALKDAVKKVWAYGREPNEPLSNRMISYFNDALKKDKSDKFTNHTLGRRRGKGNDDKIHDAFNNLRMNTFDGIITNSGTDEFKQYCADFGQILDGMLNRYWNKSFGDTKFDIWGSLK